MSVAAGESRSEVRRVEAADAGFAAALEAAQPSTRAFSSVDRAMMSANSGSPATDKGAPAAAGGWDAASATAGLETIRAIERAMPQDMENLGG